MAPARLSAPARGHHPSRGERQCLDPITPNFRATLADMVEAASQGHAGAANDDFVAGHAERRLFKWVYQPNGGVDAWHPLHAP